MSCYRRTFGLTLLLLGVGNTPSLAQGFDLARSRVASAAIHDTLRWDLKDRRDYKITDRITPATSVSLRLTHFNFLRYEPVFNTEAKQIQGYAELEKLWTQVLGFNPTAQKGGAITGVVPGESPFLKALRSWRLSIVSADSQLMLKLSEVPLSVGLTDPQVAAIADAKAIEVEEPQVLDLKRAAVEQLLLNPTTWVVADTSTKPKAVPGSAINTNPNAEAWYAQQLYAAELEKHDKLVERINLFLKRASETIDGRIKQFDSQKAGTIVTTSISVTPLTSVGNESEMAAKEKVTTVSYYVQSTMPVVFHAGPAYTNIADVDIEKVQRPAVGDVFQEVTKPKSESDLIAFMTYMLTPIGYDTPGFGLTLGTGLKDIGKRLYLGATAKFNERLLLTGGAFSQTVKEGDAALIAGANLFTSVKNVKKWGYYVSVSVSPF